MLYFATDILYRLTACTQAYVRSGLQSRLPNGDQAVLLLVSLPNSSRKLDVYLGPYESAYQLCQSRERRLALRTSTSTWAKNTSELESVRGGRELVWRKILVALSLQKKTEQAGSIFSSQLRMDAVPDGLEK